MGPIGDCYDNAVCESFHASLKHHKAVWVVAAA